MPANASGRLRLMAAEKGKDAVPLINTPEETGAPMTLAGPKSIAFVIGPAAHQTIALAETSSGRVTCRIAPGKGVLITLASSPDGKTLYFSAGGSVCSVDSSGGDARSVCTGDFVVMEPSGRSLIVTRGESTQLRMFHVPLDGGAGREIPMDRANPVFTSGGGFYSWFSPIGILDTATGHIARLPGDSLSDHHSAVWTPDGQIVATQVGLRATI